MGKLIISVIAFMMATANAFADSKVISGDVNVLRDANATFSLARRSEGRSQGFHKEME